MNAEWTRNLTPARRPRRPRAYAAGEVALWSLVVALVSVLCASSALLALAATT